MKKMVDFKFMKSVVNEEYIGSPLEQMAFKSDINGVKDALSKMGYNEMAAPQFIELIQSGYGEAKALALLKK